MIPRRFQWDEANIEHIAEHGIEPEEAEQAFDDPDRVPARVYRTPTERRRTIIGASETGRILYVVYTMRQGMIRIVSAREAEERFRRQYRRRGR